eukprot:Amastigsp_a510833_29.p4 type:complete len:101 gc:universal Amastigsp_a510833_29:400-98(-)
MLCSRFHLFFRVERGAPEDLGMRQHVPSPRALCCEQPPQTAEPLRQRQVENRALGPELLRHRDLDLKPRVCPVRVVVAGHLFVGERWHSHMERELPPRTN